MSLKEKTETALDFTRRLQAALGLNDLDLCRDLLELRGLAMESFEAGHRVAGERELRACRELISDLAEADRRLQNLAGSALAETARDFRENMVCSQNAAGGYQNVPTQACIDRKA